MSTPEWMRVYHQPAHTFIKSALLTYNSKPGVQFGDGLPLFVAFLNDTLGTNKLTVDNVQEVLELINQWDAVDGNNIEFDTRPTDPERSIEKNDRLSDIDDLIDATIRGLL